MGRQKSAPSSKASQDEDGKGETIAIPDNSLTNNLCWLGQGNVCTKSKEAGGREVDRVNPVFLNKDGRPISDDS